MLFLNFHINSCCISIQLSYDIWEMILRYFVVLSQPFLLINEFPIC